jgi:hypothetical protein
MRILVVLLAVLGLVLPTGAEAQIRLPSIKNKLIELALSQVSSPGSFEITAGAIEEPEPGVTSLVEVKVSDNEGVWMTLERVSFAWDPGALLSGELAITRLELIGLTVSRPPSETAEAPELKPVAPSGRGLFDWPRAPIDLSVQGVRLTRVSIAEGVLPQAIAFDAEGSAFDKGDLQELSLSLKRTDAVAGEIALAMRRDFAANTVTLTLEAEEAAGGIVAAAAGFPDDAPARLSLTADGPPEDWRLAFDAGVERVFDADGRARLAYAERLSVDADFSVTPGPEIGATARAVLGERATLRAHVAEREDGRIEILSGELASPALTLNANGAFATGAGESDLAVSLEALAPLADLAEGVEFERFSFDGRVTGPRGALAAEGALGLTGLATAAADAGELTLDGRVAQTPGGLDFSLDGRGEGLRIDKLGPEVIGVARLGAEGALEGDLLTLTRAELESRSLRVEASGSYDLAASGGALKASLLAPAIGPVARAYGVAAEGGISAQADVTLAGPEVDAALSAELTGFAMEMASAEQMTLEGRVTQGARGIGFDLNGAGRGLVLDQVPRDLTRELTLTARGTLREGALGLETLRLAAPLLTAEASGTVALEAGTAALDYAVSTADLGPVARAYGTDAEGALEATGRAEGDLAAPRLTGQAGIAAARFGGRDLGTVALTHAVTLGPAPEGSLALSLRGGAFGDGDAETRFRLDGAALALEGLRARLLGVAVDGQAAVELDTSLVDGDFEVSAADLRPLGRFAGIALTGAAAGRVALTPKDGRQGLATDLALSAVEVAGLRADKATLRLGAADLLGDPRLDTELTAEGIDAGRVTLATLRAKAAGPLGGIEFSAEAEGALGADPLSASLAGRADASGAVTAVTLSRAGVTAGPDTVELRQPLALRIRGGTVAAEGLDLALPEEGALTGRAALHPGGFSGDLTLARLPLTVLERWAAVPVTAGLMDIKAVFDTRPGRAGAELSARARGIGFAKTHSAAGSLDVDLDAGWDGRQTEARAEIRGEFGDPLRARLALPLRPGPGGVPQVPAEGELDGSLAWAGDIGDLWALVPAAAHILDGRADIDLRLSGTMAAPRVAGRAELTNGEYQNLDAGTILTGLAVTTDIAGDGTVNVALDGSDGAKGTVAARAALRLGGAAPALELTATIDRAVLVRRDDVTAKISGDLAMAGPLADLALTGALKVEKAEVRLVDATPPEVVDLEGIRIKGAPEPEGNGKGESALSLDLTITAPRDIFVRGRGLESEWKMDLAITGDAARPVVTGEVEKVRGRLDLLGRDFDLARGRVTFDGGTAIDPLVDVSLEREANGIRGGIVVEGRASAPRLRFAATPTLPEDEVLPRLLFGQSKQSLSGPEAIQLATGIATLLSGKAGPLDFAREAVGMDVLRIEGETAEEATVTVGRNIGDGVFLGARQGLQGQGTTVMVEVDVFGGVKVDSEITQEGSSNVGITWRKDF